MSVLSSKIGKSYVLISALISAFFMLLIVIILLINSLPAMHQIGLNLFTVEWNPYKSKFGILSMIYGSAIVTAIALIIAVPIGLFSAFFISEIMPPQYRFYVKSLLEILAGIPSIIYGLIGIVYLNMWIRDLFELDSGRTILTAGILLSVMILPTIITLSDEVFHNIPQKYREAAHGLGLYKYEMIKTVILPVAFADIIGVVLLALGRALGETMAVMLVIGGIDKIPIPITNILIAGQTITSKIGREIAETTFGSIHFSSLIFMSLLLLLTNLLFITVTQRFFNPERLYE